VLTQPWSWPRWRWRENGDLKLITGPCVSPTALKHYVKHLPTLYSMVLCRKLGLQLALGTDSHECTTRCRVTVCQFCIQRPSFPPTPAIASTMDMHMYNNSFHLLSFQHLTITMHPLLPHLCTTLFHTYNATILGLPFPWSISSSWITFPLVHLQQLSTERKCGTLTR